MDLKQARHVHSTLVVGDHHHQEINIGIPGVTRAMHVRHHAGHIRIHLLDEGLEISRKARNLRLRRHHRVLPMLGYGGLGLSEEGGRYG